VEIARDILQKINYDPHLSTIIIANISVHDNWVFGDDLPFKASTEMALFNDLDFLYAQSSLQQFKYCAESLGLKTEEMYEFWMKDEKLTRRPFCCKQTKKLFERLMKERKRELEKIKKLSNGSS